MAELGHAQGQSIHFWVSSSWSTGARYRQPPSSAQAQANRWFVNLDRDRQQHRTAPRALGTLSTPSQPRRIVRSPRRMLCGPCRLIHQPSAANPERRIEVFSHNCPLGFSDELKSAAGVV